jgi:hypothetical protein
LFYKAGLNLNHNRKEKLNMQRQKPVDIDTGVLRRNRVLVLNTPSAVLFLDFGPRSQWLRRLAIAQGLAKSYNPDEPRVPSGSGRESGEWTGDGGATADASPKPAAGRPDATRAKKERFIDAHLADAQKAADKLGVPVENILGLSALESEWGESRFAIQGNNYFGIHYPAPFASGYMVAANGIKVSTFASYADSLNSFVAISGSIVQDESNPETFVAALQNSKKFGVDTTTGAKDPAYVGTAVAIIRGLRSIISRRAT